MNTYTADPYREYLLPEEEFHEKTGVKYGTLETVEYYSTTVGCTRRTNVILPPDYDPTKKYPVLYLLHGLGGDINEWLYGDPVHTVGNAVADGAESFIIVQPNVRARKNDACNPPDAFSIEHYRAFDNFINDLKTDLMPFINSHYPTLTDRKNTAVAGLSMGGRESIYIGFSLPELFGYIGAFSPAPGIFEYTNMNVHEDGLLDPDNLSFPDGLTPEVIMLVTGDNDGLVGPFPIAYHEAFEKNGIAHTFFIYPGGHDFGVWRPGLYHFAKAIFK